MLDVSNVTTDAVAAAGAVPFCRNWSHDSWGTVNDMAVESQPAGNSSHETSDRTPRGWVGRGSCLWNETTNNRLIQTETFSVSSSNLHFERPGGWSRVE